MSPTTRRQALLHAAAAIAAAGTVRAMPVLSNDDAPAPLPPSGDASVVISMPGLVAFWTFGEDPGQPRQSKGTASPHPLQEVGGPIAVAAGGPYSGRSLALDGKHYLRIPHAELGDLDIHGRHAQVSMFAVVRLEPYKKGVTIAGIWSEGQGANDDTGTRQYALLLNMPAYGGTRQVVPHVSSEGGVTRRADGSGLPWCADYAASRSQVHEHEWVTMGFTYDGDYLRAYYNGQMEERSLNAKADHRDDPYFTKEGPNGSDRGMNPYYHGRGIFTYDPAQHATTKPDGPADFTVAARYAVGSMLGEALKGRFGALAVFNRALSDDDMRRLHESAGIDRLS
jgi:hypothetical protein